MKTLVLVLPLICCLVRADSADKQDVKQKTATTTLNIIPPTPKQELYYQQVMKAYQQNPQYFQQPQRAQIIQQRPQLIPVQIIAKPYYVHPSQIHPHQQQQQQQQQQPQATMIIIAQPALVPQSLLYGNPTQQLLNYFHSNPQAKYQLLHGGVGSYQQAQPHQHPQQLQHLQQIQQVQPTYVHQVLASAPAYGNYILAPQQYHQQPSNLISTPSAPQQISPHSHLSYSQASQSQSSQMAQHQHQPSQLSSIAHLAQLAAQQYVASPMKQAPAIVTGFEHFSPEQQAQIKAQLSSHLGSNFHAISANNNNAQSAEEDSSAGGAQYSSKYNAQKTTQEFVPSPQIKNDIPTTMATSGSGEIHKTQYKG